MFTILLVEDNPDLRAVFQLVLEELGYRVFAAANGKEGLNAAISYLPDLVLTDWNMPEMDGEQLCERLRRHPVLASVPIVVLSARPPSARNRALWTMFLHKPVSVKILELTVVRLLSGRLPRASIRPFSADPAPSRWQPVLSKCWP